MIFSKLVQRIKTFFRFGSPDAENLGCWFGLRELHGGNVSPAEAALYGELKKTSDTQAD